MAERRSMANLHLYYMCNESEMHSTQSTFTLERWWREHAFVQAPFWPTNSENNLFLRSNLFRSCQENKSLGIKCIWDLIFFVTFIKFRWAILLLNATNGKWLRRGKVVVHHSAVSSVLHRSYIISLLKVSKISFYTLQGHTVLMRRHKLYNSATFEEKPHRPRTARRCAYSEYRVSTM